MGPLIRLDSRPTDEISKVKAKKKRIPLLSIRRTIWILWSQYSTDFSCSLDLEVIYHDKNAYQTYNAHYIILFPTASVRLNVAIG